MALQLELPEDFPIPPSLALQLAGTCASHPFLYAKALIQLGHEPLAARQTKTLLGRPALAYPSVFSYVSHIRAKDGWTGLWRGLTPKLCSLALQHLTQEKFNESYPAEPELAEQVEEELTEEEKRERFLKVTLREIACKITCVVVTHPLQVIAYRAMAEFVGGDGAYSGGLTFGLYGGVCEIVKENGIVGLWSGLVPRLLGDVGILATTAGLTFLVNNYVVSEKEMKQYTGHLAGLLASSLFYPFQVVTTCMAVSRSGLAMGYPPCMPFYGSWLDCLQQLKARNQLKRGSSLLWRYYSGPQMIVGDRVHPLDSTKLRSPLKAA